MNDHLLYWIWLATRPGLGPVRIRQLLELVGDPGWYFAADAEAMARLGLSRAAREALLDKNLDHAQAILRACERLQISVLTLASAAYPAAMRQTADAPAVLYCRGSLPVSGRQPWIGLVGARQADERGLALAGRFGAEIAACGGVVVTGMAKGIDAAAARGALEQGCPVVGVLGGGVDVVYPRENAALFRQVAANGCLLSEYPPETTPNARHFPARNRIISALSDGVVVIQAAEGSGALITARWAADQGRDVFSVPGPAGDALSRGSNQLLRDGAILVESGRDVMREYLYRYPGAVRMQNAECKMQNEGAGDEECNAGAVTGRPPEAQASDFGASAGEHSVRQHEAARPDVAVRPLPADLTPEQAAIVTALQDGPMQLDALIDKTGLPASKVLPQLTVLQIKKILRQLPGKLYERSGG